MYLIVQKLINKKAGYIAASILSVQSYHIWVSRIGIQDGGVIFFGLLIIWLWLEALDKNKLYLWCLWGVALGLGIITKLTILIIVPILLAHAFAYKHNIFKNKFFWRGIGMCALASSPYWIYNLALYKNFGHFDFQISAFLNQNVEKWQFRQGRQMVGDLNSRIRFFFETMRQANSIIFNSLAGVSFVASIYLYIRKRSKLVLFLLLALVIEILWFLIIGSTLRFVVMVIPYFIFIIAYLSAKILQQKKYNKLFFAFFGVFILVELLFSVNSFLVHPSYGRVNTAYAQINVEMRNFGFNEVNDYLDEYLSGKVSAAFGKPVHQFMVDLHNEAIDNAKKKSYQKFPLVIIYDYDFNFLSRLWTFQRRLIFRGWPAMSDEAMYGITGDKWDEYYREQGIENFLYFTGIEDKEFGVGQLYTPYKLKLKNTEFEDYLLKKGIKPEYIKNAAGEDVFRVYKF
jgi:hypothetical protein